MGDTTLAACTAASPTADPDPVRPEAPLRYRGIPLGGPRRLFHLAVDRLDADTVPESYWRKVVADRPLAGGERGVER